MSDVLIDGELVSEEVSPENHEYLGLWKPPYDQCGSVVRHNFGRRFDTHNAKHNAWMNGEFDKPIYKRRR